MKKSLPLSIVYVKDLRKVAEFYVKTLTLPVIEEAADFILLGDDTLEIVVARMREALMRKIYTSTPPAIREDTPLKCSYEVADLTQVSAAAAATGGGTKPIASAWLWRGQRHLDGHDPESNVVQFRQREA